MEIAGFPRCARDKVKNNRLRPETKWKSVAISRYARDELLKPTAVSPFRHHLHHGIPVKKEAARMSATARWTQERVADSAAKQSARAVIHVLEPAEAIPYESLAREDC